jgi:hypothetical protein
MALTYEESAALMSDMNFQQRIKVAVLTFAEYILGEATDVPAHNTRLRWAQSTFTSPQMSAMQVQPIVVMDPAVQQDGAAVTDPQLQSAVENAVQKMF